jgi:DNA-binding response OmpR family regulator
MRPKKKILLVGSSEQRGSVLKFTLETNHFAVTETHSATEALEYIDAARYDLLLCELPLDGAAHLIDYAHKTDEKLHSLVLLGNLVQLPDDLHASAVITKKEFSVYCLLERMKVLTARKRGPYGRRILPAAASALPEVDRRLA